ncbi:unnamed protein product [Thlaspi arvense]|uniref:DC1 domain-containing protein n=1 Tax=Thlaspi arvense TaxID=13288 RepID=A0AAU9S621_THLAR|nr:unnamed protein product [Thlaspi arvense]
MSSLGEQQAVQHFIHVHPVTKVEGFGGFKCNGCKTYGFGKTYRCIPCNYDLHEYCATCPPTLLSFLHPEHELQLVFKGPAQTPQDRRGCNICHELAEGLYYQCEPCGFEVHPLCSQLPKKVTHVPHRTHPLELSHMGASNMCMVCQGAIRSWRYKCGPCRFDVHMACVNSSASAARSIQQTSSGPQACVPPSQYHQPCHNHVCGCGHTNQGEQQSGSSTGQTMFSTLLSLSVECIPDLISSTACAALTGGC